MSRVRLDGPARTRSRALDWPGPARWSLTLAFFAALNWLLLAPEKIFHDLHIFLAFQDKIAHFSIFLALAALVRWSLPAGRDRGWLRVPVLGALALYAGSIELAQPLLAKAGRQFEWLDMASNYAGVAAGWVVGGTLLLSGPEDAAAPARLPAPAAFADAAESKR